ncbi:hypothetical protein CRG98_019740 [Punica granatum]|uniref:Uncharacterized protein n=1 Tax=Punica granatum TaxID=22663 RepID=A0A2I0JU74_PUNGR|nr:hypothetical protein CRG98_019740 [Punica granatum]
MPSGNPVEPVQLFLKAVPGNFYKAVKAAEEAVGIKVSCLLTDAFFGFGADMAREMGVPWVPVWFSGDRPLLAHINTDLIRKTFGSGDFEGKNLEFIPGFESVRAMDLPQDIIEPNPNSEFSVMIDKMAATLSQATAIAINSVEELDPLIVKQLRSHLQKVLSIGPITPSCPMTPFPDSYGCIPWLDEQKPASVVYISFGSVITPPPHELTALSEALEEIGVPFLWSFRGNAEEKLPQDFVRRTRESSKSKIVSWAPQLDVLRHKAVAAFLTQCGWNSLLESFIGGVPTIMRPFFGDQQLNRLSIETLWRAGVGLERGVITKTGTIAALKRVLFTEDGVQMRQRASELNGLVMRAVETSGSSTKNFESLVDIVTK